MKILIAPDSFKDSLPAKEVALNIRQGILEVLPDAEIRILPMADGGEGTVRSLVDATGGEMIRVKCHDPLMREIDSFYGILGDKKTAVIEMAAASGIELLNAGERNPWNTTTYGTGELIKMATHAGCKKIIIGIGGSATNDCGAGMLNALGVHIFDNENNPISYTGGGLEKAVRIDITGLDDKMKDISLTVACDVKNPLLGKDGASYTYAPQKGATAETMEKLENNVNRFAGLIQDVTGTDVRHIEGAGAAGGTGAALLAFLNAELKPGIEIVKKINRLDEHCSWADIVITGEGKIDDQTRYGKTPRGVLETAKKYNKPVIVVAGTLGKDYESLYKTGFDAIFSIIDKPMALEEAMKQTPRLLKNLAITIMKTILIGHR